jgi:hypothetical protein
VDREREPAGDYGYDLAHEESPSARPAEHTDPQPRGQAPAHPTEAGGDYGYDEAHGF